MNQPVNLGIDNYSTLEFVEAIKKWQSSTISNYDSQSIILESKDNAYVFKMKIHSSIIIICNGWMYDFLCTMLDFDKGLKSNLYELDDKSFFQLFPIYSDNTELKSYLKRYDCFLFDTNIGRIVNKCKML